MQIDFAENCSCKYQDEVQTSHWNQEQITLFIVCESHTIVSDELSHDKTSVTVFMSKDLDEFVKQKHSDVTMAYIFYK